jgi:hypothetical protein
MLSALHIRSPLTMLCAGDRYLGFRCINTGR